MIPPGAPRHETDDPAGRTAPADPVPGRPATHAHPGDFLHARVGEFLIEGEMDRGGTGIVYRARHVDSGRAAALKMPRSSSALERELLRREIAMLGRLSTHAHPGVVEVLASDRDAPVPWYAMELILGEDLAAHLDRAFGRGPAESSGGTVALDATAALEPTVALGGIAPPLPPPSFSPTSGQPSVTGAARDLTGTLEVALGIAHALAFIHGEGVVHGDLSPRNVILRGGEDPVLVDFGTALHAGAREAAVQRDDFVLGTAAYMAPEQILGERIDARADLYAFGCILFELLTGRPPFVGGDAAGLRAQHLSAEPPAPSGLMAGLPAVLDDLVLALLRKDRATRIGWAEEAIAALEGALGRTLRRRVPRAPLFRPRLIDRTETLEALSPFVNGLRQGQGARVFVTGEGGIGKTRLMNELTARTPRAIEVVVSQCTPAAGCIDAAALQPFQPLLRRVAERWGAGEAPPRSEALGEALDVLASYEPALRTLPDVDPERPPVLAEAAGRTRVLASLGCVVAAVSASRPLLLAIDDLQAADELTLELLERTPADAAWGRVLLVGAYRTDAATERTRRLAAAPADARLVLPRLSGNGVRALAMDMLAARLLPEGLPEFLERHSGGNPMFAAEYLRAAVARGLLTWQPGLGFSASLGGGHWGDVAVDTPAALAEAFSARLRTLGPAARALLPVAVILGREFPGRWLEVLATHAGGPSTAVTAEALERLVAAQVLEEAGAGRYRFVHEALREAEARAIPAPLRARLHRLVAERLERSLGTADAALDPSPTAAEVGLHWAEAGEPARAFPHLDAAARLAERTYANARAADLYRMALRQAERLAEDDPAWTAELRRTNEALGDLLLRGALHVEARQRFDAALAASAPTERLARARLHRKRAHSHWSVHEYDTALAALAAAEEALGPQETLEGEEEKREWIEVMYGRFSVKYYARQTGEETAALIRALEPVIEAHGTLLQRIIFYQSAMGDAAARARYAYSEEAVRFARRGVVAADQGGGSAAERANARLTLGFVLLSGDGAAIKEASAALEEAFRAAVAIGDRTVSARALTYQTIAARRLRRREETRRLADELRVVSEAAKLAPYAGVAEACTAWVALQCDDLPAAIAAGERAREWWRSNPHPFPFRWLGSLVLLAGYRAREQWSSIPELIEDLLGTDQQALPGPVAAPLESARSSPPDPEEIDRALRAAVEAALL